MNGTLKRMPSWEEEDCCNWEGVVCRPRTRHVVQLKLSECIQDSRGQVHEINSSLLALTELNHLDLSYNHFYNVSFPKFIGSFKKLKYLNLSNSFFTGSIPLDDLDWLTHLSSLKHLDISGLLLTNLPDWLLPSNLQGSLTALITRGCNLNSIPVSPSNVNFTSLEILDISDNHFNTTLPHWVWNITSLTHLDLGYSEFYGTIPEAIGALTSLTYLDLSNNYIEGTIPTSIKHLLRLESLRLHGNQLSGSLNSWIEHLTSLTFVNLCHNILNGSVPTGIGKLSNLTSLYLCYNRLQGNVSEVHMENLTRLEVLDLSYNYLKVSVDPNWVAVFQLVSVQLIGCEIGPQIPRWLQSQTRIETLDLSNNKIAETLPSWLVNVSSSTLTTLHLSGNQIKGKLPTFSDVSRLINLRLDTNQFEGQLDDLFSYNYSSTEVQLPSWSNIVELSLSNNKLEGAIPLSVCNWTGLNFLHLSNNSLTGEIPHCLGESLKGLFTLDLANNNLFGKIPTTFGSMSLLAQLVLNNNGFSGQLPSSLQNCTYLSYLDLAHNAFSGSIPPWMGESLQGLQVLHLGYNIFSGGIPQQLTLLEELKILDLSNNNFSGSLPYYLGNFTAMASISRDSYEFTEYVDLVIPTKGGNLHYPYESDLTTSLDFSGNNLTGEISPEIGRLIGLHNLNLSRNHLSGKIPQEIGEIALLESLDLSFNELSGTIPSSLADLNFLSYINLSYNNLMGRIPSGPQLQTLNDTSRYMGNPGLCGPPVSSGCLVVEAVDKVQNMSNFEWIWLCIAMVLGFLMGFWTFCGFLFFKREWRYAYFRGIDSCYDRISLRLHFCLARLSGQD
ncbi:receptor-like protein EIX2 [Curcuma longa]|uniref:receptor-like protein EIX2 n=1 Tax=Curcuma longa TaxID=136217 RepID=UPI003D9E10D7